MEDTLEIINCPACQKPMQKVFITHTGFNLDVCADGCGGIFFDNRELKFFDEKHENINEIVDVLKGKTFEKVDESKTRICPICGNKMVKNYVSIKKEIQIDEDDVYIPKIKKEKKKNFYREFLKEANHYY